MSRSPRRLWPARSSPRHDRDYRREGARRDHGERGCSREGEASREQRGHDGDDHVGSMPNREHDDPGERRGDRKVDPEPPRVADRTPDHHPSERREIPQHVKGDCEGEVVREAAAAATEVPRRHGKALVGEEEPRDQAPDDRQPPELAAQRCGHQQMPKVDKEDTRDDDRRRCLVGEKLHHRELRGAGENEKTHRRDLKGVEPGLASDNAEGRSDDESGCQDRPPLGQRAARRLGFFAREMDQTGSASNSARRWPRSTCCPTLARTRVTFPSAGASTRSSIFIASTTKRRSPRRTRRSATAWAAMTRPGIGAATSAPAAASIRRSRGPVSISHVVPPTLVHTMPALAAAAAWEPSTSQRCASSRAATRWPAYVYGPLPRRRTACSRAPSRRTIVVALPSPMRQAPVPVHGSPRSRAADATAAAATAYASCGAGGDSGTSSGRTDSTRPVSTCVPGSTNLRTRARRKPRFVRTPSTSVSSSALASRLRAPPRSSPSAMTFARSGS